MPLDKRFIPIKPKRVCNHGGCTELTEDRYCKEHKRVPFENERNDEHKRITGKKLQRERERLLRKEIFCAYCLKRGRRTIATIRDHIIPLAEGGEDKAHNTQALCKECHKIKTLQEATRARWHTQRHRVDEDGTFTL